MIKTLIAANRSEREKFNVPRSVQQSIPIRRIYKDGIWQVGEKYSRTWRFTDINYAVAGEDDQRIMFQSYSGAPLILWGILSSFAVIAGIGFLTMSTASRQQTN